MFGELLLCALITAVLTVSCMLAPPSLAKPLVKTERPPNHLAQLDFFRVIFCFGVMAYHCTAPMGSILTHSPANAKNRSFWWYSVSEWGYSAVNVFYVISAFLTTTKMLSALSKGRPVDRLRSTIERFLRLWPLLLVPAAWGLLRHDASLYARHGQPSPLKWVGWFTFTGNLFPPLLEGQWFFDVTFIPCWSLLLDFQATVLLFFIIPFHYRRWGLQTWPLAVLAAVFQGIRTVIFSMDAACFVSHMDMDGMVLAGMPNAREFFETTYGFGPIDHLASYACPKMISQVVADYQSKMYMPLYTRFQTFLIGSILAIKFFQVKQGTTPLGSELGRCGSAVVGRVLLALSGACFWVLVVNPHRQEYEFLMRCFKCVWFHTLTSIASAITTFCVIVPEGHPYHVAWLSRFMGAKCFYVLGNASTWMYVLHWPILLELLRHYKPKLALGNVFQITAIVGAVAFPSALFFMRFLDAPLEALRKHLMDKPEPPGKDAEPDMQSVWGAVGKLEPHEAQHYFKRLGPGEARALFGHLGGKHASLP